jgi:hypothetical protein
LARWVSGITSAVQWIDARARHESELAAFYRRRFRPGFEPAFSAWLATSPLRSAAAPPTPFAMPQYRLADANQRADNYMLAVVLFASALCFAGISSKMDSVWVRTALLGLSGLILLANVLWIASLPVRLTI